MKYLFIVQGEGRGHLTQALSLAQLLQDNGHEVPEILVGTSNSRKVPAFFYERTDARVRTFESPNFSLAKNQKKVRLAHSILKNLTPQKLHRFKKSIEMIHRRIEKNQPDAVVNFYEILAGLTNLRFREQVPFISIAHQFLTRHPDFKYDTGNEPGAMLLRLNTMLCGIGAVKTLALSFYPLRDDYKERIAVVPPLLRREVMQLQPEDKGYILGYILNPGYLDEIKAWHKKHPETEIHLFWDKKDPLSRIKTETNLHLHGIDDQLFLRYMEGCSGYITTAGFESVCEAMYLGKPAMMIPAHIEQEMNAADAVNAGAGISGKTFDLSRLQEFLPVYAADTTAFRQWVESGKELFIRHLTTFV